MKTQTTMTPEGQTKDLEQYLSLSYPIELVESDGAYVASFPDLPGCTSYGETPDDAIRSLKSVQRLWIEGRLAMGQPIPEPAELDAYSGKFVLRIPRELHKSLEREAKNQGVSLNQYVAHILSERHMLASLRQNLASELVHAFLGQIERALRTKWQIAGARPITRYVGDLPGNISLLRHMAVPEQQITYVYETKHYKQIEEARRHYHAQEARAR